MAFFLQRYLAGNSTTSTISPYNDDRFFRNDYDDNMNETGTLDHGRDAYEFVAFLLWYLFLVLCCVIPTCCAYKRRRVVEARMQHQQDSVNRIERQNLFILSSLRQSQQNTDSVREQRGEMIAESLKATSMTVEEGHLVDISGDDKNAIPKKSTVVKVVDDQNHDGDSSDEISGANSTNNLAIEFDVEAADAENTHALRIPVTVEATTDNSNNDDDDDDDGVPKAAAGSTRLVPASCAICLCPYEEDDEITWSPRKECQHAFHSECIIPWLAKTDEPKCPCCRQDYCDPVAMASQVDHSHHFHRLHHNHHPMSLFGATNFSNLEDDSDLVLPHFMRSLEASRLDFLTTLELASMEASARAARDQQTAEANRDGEDGSPPSDVDVEMSEIQPQNNDSSLEVDNGNGEVSAVAVNDDDVVPNNGEGAQRPAQQSSESSAEHVTV